MADGENSPASGVKSLINSTIEQVANLKDYRLVDPTNYVKLEAEPTYNDGFLATAHYADFLNDEHFKRSVELGLATTVKGELSGFHKLYWSFYVICWAADRAKNLEGDFVECGVYRGTKSKIITYYTHFEKLDKTFYLLDTFSGLAPEHITSDEDALGVSEIKYEDDYYEDAVRAFSDFPNVKLIKGSVPETLSQVTSEKIAYLALDMNNITPEIAAAEYFWDRIVSGGVIMLDDYGWQGSTMQRHAHDAFAASKGLKVLMLPTAQGMLIKP